eukprot:CAMPEP_0174841266 /NCGR_PEP_ID=MMETSP1114-20130205/9203_1 /TAXON_ID=312471 /ORGANISM="Neobodo designis, Strain CCAP 1951/1" /LENGTH=188 /DNA_ID=CAMNT_0016075447 /DNA_START=518 /DNA_END=1085 /DNA_ORIENTATION=+
MASFGSGRDGFKVVRKPAGVDDRAALDAFGAMTTTAKAPSAGATAEVEKGAGCVDATSKVSDRQPGSSCVRVDPQTNCWHRPGVRVSSQTCEQTRGGCNEFCVREKLLVVVPIDMFMASLVSGRRGFTAVSKPEGDGAVPASSADAGVATTTTANAPGGDVQPEAGNAAGCRADEKSSNTTDHRAADS